MLYEMVNNQVCPKTVPKVQETLTEAQGARNIKKNFRGFNDEAGEREFQAFVARIIG